MSALDIREMQKNGDAEFAPWRQVLLARAPLVDARLMDFVKTLSEGSRSGKLNHLIWIAVDAVPSHLYPRGIGLHCARALDAGATPEELFEAMEIATALAGRTFAVGLPIVAEVAALPEIGGDAEAAEILARYERVFTETPPWLSALSTVAPDCAKALVELVFAPEKPALDPLTRTLICFAVASCPAVCDPDGARHYAKAAVAQGASAADLVSVLKLASGIAIHSLSTGSLSLDEILTYREAETGSG